MIRAVCRASSRCARVPRRFAISVRAVAAHSHREQSRRSFFFDARPLAAAVCVVAVAKAASSSDSDSDDEFVEPASGFKFPRVLADGSRLVSASTRTISFLKFHAYALAFYVVGPVRAPADGALASVFDSAANASWSLDIRPCRETVGNHLTSAWLPKITKQLEPISEADVARLAQLASIMDAQKRKYAYASSIKIVWDKRTHTLSVAHDGKPLGSVSDADRVARALFALYTEVPAISEDFARGLGSNVNKQK